jgi:hypothetical protein
VARAIMFVMFAAAVAALDAQTRDTAVESLLRAAASYLTEYEQKLGGVVAEELYVQDNGATRRILKSEMLFISDQTYGWIEFRDVLEVDGLQVRNRETRVMHLFAKPHPDRLKQAQRIAAEGARFNLNQSGAGGTRTINYPHTTLRFLRGQAHFRSAFRVAADRRPRGPVTLEFQEQAMPRLIRTNDNGAARGRFVIEGDSGRVIASELTLPAKHVTAVVKVTFARDRRLGLWLPREMEERYLGAGGMTGHAEYSGYRQFRVDTSMEAAKVPH